jgi:Xaa-Pro aminopeptidase
MSKNLFSGIFIDDGLGEKAKAHYKKRREKFAKAFKHPIILYGFENILEHDYAWFRHDTKIVQTPLLRYLTGINQPDIALFLDPNSETLPEILFVPKIPAIKAFWEGESFGLGNKKHLEMIKAITGFSCILNIKSINKTVLNYYKSTENPVLGTIWSEVVINNKEKKVLCDANYKFKKKIQKLLQKNGFSPNSLISISDLELKERLVLDGPDLNNARLACQKTTEVFLNLLPKIKHFSSETEASGFLTGLMHMSTPFGLSFPPIVASGPNSTVLHYQKNNDSFSKNELLLLDFGICWQNVTSDSSRTIPISGKFNPLQKLLYNLVLDAQKLVEQNVKAGVTINQLNAICWGYLNQELKTRFLDLGGQMKLKYQGQPHNVGHLIAHQVHDGDPSRLYREIPLLAGQLITNEPGLYGHFSITIDNIKYSEDIGIRIEDVLLVTPTGSENLNKTCPKEIIEIEARME